jgi:hypothetical protein
MPWGASPVIFMPTFTVVVAIDLSQALGEVQDGLVPPRTQQHKIAKRGGQRLQARTSGRLWFRRFGRVGGSSCSDMARAMGEACVADES